MDNLNNFLSINLEDADEETQEKLYRILIESNVNDFPKRTLRQILQLVLSSLKYKGKQAATFQGQLDQKSDAAGDESGNEAYIEEIERLKILINKLESEKSSLKVKLKEMNEEIIILQNRLHEISINGSDKDSNDPLSELDKHEELLKKISIKNKHIKRLIRDIESLQIQNIEQSKIIIELEKKFQIIASEKLEFQSQLAFCENEKNQFKEHINELTSELSKLESNISYLEEEREKADIELKDFIDKLEERARAWRKLIDEKEKQLDSLKQKYELLRNEYPKKKNNAEEEHEIEKLIEAIQERDGFIEELEIKIKNMAEEMIASTKLMNQISAEREVEKLKDSKNNRTCCKTTQDSLNLLQERYKELSEMMEKVEEDNIFKSKQTAAVLKSMGEFQNEDGEALGNSLRKITNLERKLESRDKQIKALIMEINSLHELSQENSVLRKKLNIPEDEIILTTNLVAKQRNKDKMMERLTLKFRASEEMRLQLKLDKTELKKEIIELRKKLTDMMHSNNNQATNEQNYIENKEAFPQTRNEIFCDNCLKKIQSIPNQENVIKDVVKEWEDKYSEVIEENENLRVGMHEILEKIRDYDASSDHITIDCTILEKVLHALDARSISGWYHPAMRMQNELIAVKEREHALKEKVHFVEKSAKSGRKTQKTSKSDSKKQSTTSEDKTDKTVIELTQTVEHVNDNIVIDEEELGEISLSNNQRETVVEESTKSNESTEKEKQPTDFLTLLIDRSFEQETYKKELNKLKEKNRDLQLENDALKTYKIQFSELIEEMKKSEKEIVNYCSALIERFTELELQSRNSNKKYEFLKEDFDKCLSDFKFSENINISLISDLKKQINNKKHEINLIKLVENRRKSSSISKDENLILKRKYSEIENQLAILISTLFKDKENHKDLIEEIGINFGIIKDDMQLDFVTVEEFQNMKNSNKSFEEENNNLRIKFEQLEENLLITEEQVNSQQKLISEITDNHIDLRHLVADLQSSSEEKFLITKSHRDLEIAKKENVRLRQDKENVEKQVQDEKRKIEKLTQNIEDIRKKSEKRNINNELKIEFLKKYVFSLQEKYCKFTPLINLTNFASIYAKFLNKSKEERKCEETYLIKINEFIANKLKSKENSHESLDIVKLVQYEVKCIFLEDKLKINKQKLENAEKELNAVQIASIEGNQQWKTIQALFGEEKEVIETKNITVQTINGEFNDIGVNTDKLEEIIVEKILKNEVSKPVSIPEKSDFECQVPTPTIRRSLERQDTIIIQPAAVAPRQISFDKEKINEEITSLENQLQQAKNLASKRSAMLLDVENKLAEANGRNKEMEKIINELKRTVKIENFNAEKKTSGIIETTITSLQSLLSEKDTTLNHYQELLKTEREQHLKSCETYDKEIIQLKKIQADNANMIENKNQEISKLKNRLEETIKRNSLRNGNNNDGEKVLSNEEFDQNCDNSLNEISDEKIEEMFLDENKNLTPPSTANFFLNLANLDECPLKQIQHLQSQIRESKNRELFWENSLRAKEEEILLLEEKLGILQERENPDDCGNAEINQLKVLLEEKDKHINDLMETLTSFHDDQQRFLSETSLYSADQMTQLGANLNRCEATNKILQTQLDALKRQLTTLSQREKQSRDLANSLRNQLIKRPVLSIKSEVNSKAKNEQQKRIQQLESELEISKKEIQQQQHIIDTKRAKNAIEVNMWEKQKRHQQNAEKLKLKLEETEKTLEKTRSLLNAARTTINRLDRDKNALQAAALKGVRTTATEGFIIHKCCQISSCPNFQMVKSGHHFDSMENSTTCQSECSTERVRDYNVSSEFVDELKSKIEYQQRRIHALELSSKGSNAMVSEVEKLQERISALEAQNIRWEAKNLQLQLDLDLIRQGNENDRNKKRIKYLEDYILALKEELAQAEAKKEYKDQVDNNKKLTATQAEQTILALKRIIERLKIENKTLKDGRTSHYSCRNDDSNTTELSRLKHLYAEAMNKISALQVELELKTNCRNTNISTGDGDFMRELKFVKQQLIKKTQLLEKAKILLTRAAAKEKSLKDQLTMWKRKCSELQNVPVIEEISE